MARRGFHVVGVDRSEKFIALAHGAAAEESLTARFEVADVRDLAYDGEFDAAICLCQGGFGLVGGHDEIEVFGRIVRSVRPGGAVAISAFSAAFARLDRLARDLVLQEQLLAEVRRLGADVFSTSGGESAYPVDDPDDPSRRLIRQILGAVNEYERGMIRLRLRSGRARKAHVGGYAYGGPPFGFAASNGTLIPIGDEQRVIKEVTAAHNQGRSLRAIADDLNRRGVGARRGRWHPSTISRIVRRASGPST